MKTAGIASLKARLSHYLAAVKHGQEVVVTERGRPVARIVPIRGGEERQSRAERLARAGLLQLGRGRLPPLPVEAAKGRSTHRPGSTGRAAGGASGRPLMFWDSSALVPWLQEFAPPVLDYAGAA